MLCHTSSRCELTEDLVFILIFVNHIIIITIIIIKIPSKANGPGNDSIEENLDRVRIKRGIQIFKKVFFFWKLVTEKKLKCNNRKIGNPETKHHRVNERDGALMYLATNSFDVHHGTCHSSPYKCFNCPPLKMHTCTAKGSQKKREIMERKNTYRLQFDL